MCQILAEVIKKNKDKIHTKHANIFFWTIKEKVTVPLTFEGI